ncbi:zinc-binding dehydrogenase [Roseomonas sp. OT10]|uniref:zinc-binding dehydrogenase n=1 Tax=Roseomonas cutis TaxID=2897332 RepID=UPI001E461439|nr:zinc-binding dehydrogenase [Roseomonas sp. OT10]UFN49959.1 zinc-binding dehydrogenase [Roseomonas sp. OT10]
MTSDQGQAPGRMRAIGWRRCGAPEEVLELLELPRPAPGPGKVLVRIGVSAPNPHDTKARTGWRGVGHDGSLVIPHGDGAGVVAAVGEGVPGSRIGERVWVFGAPHGRGTCAEYAVLPAGRAVPLPPEVPLAQGAVLGVPCLTAHLALFSDGPVAGRTVLVQGGAGAVGLAAVLIAARAGARVLATASTEEKRAAALAAGAEAAVDYRAPDAAERLLALTGGRGVDRVVEVDFGANAAMDARLVAPHGVIAAYSSTREPKPVLDYYAFARKGVTLRFVQAMLLHGEAERAGVAAVREGVAAGWLRLPLGLAVPLERAAEAQAALEAGRPGKPVVVVAPGLA